MKIALSRRMFLQGASGALLAVPTLTSLLPRSSRAADPLAPPLRYVQWVTDHGQHTDRFFPSSQYTPTVEVAPGVRSRPLAEISGPISQILGPKFDAVRSKMNVVRGLDVLAPNGFHNACAPTCASYPPVDNHVPKFPHSVDSILEQSSTVYPSVPRIPALRLTPGVSSSYKWGSFSWTRQNGEPFKLPAYDSNQAALEAVFGGAGGFPAPDDPLIQSRVRLTDEVLGDYAQLMNIGALSAADRAQLSNYMDLLADVQNRMLAEVPDCSEPQLVPDSDFEVLHENAIDIAVIALLCGATRVVAYHCYQGSATAYDEETFHTWAHDDADLHAGMQIWRYDRLARLLERLDSVTEANGQTLLDNTIVYANNELSHPGHPPNNQRVSGNTHLVDMPVITAGSGGGRFVTGEYIDFGARLLNNMLVTFFDAMDLTPEEYERDGVEGFGDYDGIREADYAAYMSTSARRDPLPYLYEA